MDSIRINKYLAEQGYASRREADRLIEEGRVRINGQIAHLGDRVSEKDQVEINLPEVAKTYLAYHKPRGQATEHIKCPAGTYPLGRLDKESEGLLLVTNDGRLTERLLSPESHAEKEYVVEVDKKIQGIDLKRMSEGVRIERDKTMPAQAEKINDQTFRLILTEGKKHQIRRMCAALGYQVTALKRIRFANIRLNEKRLGPPAGGFRALSIREREQLLDSLGLN